MTAWPSPDLPELPHPDGPRRSVLVRDSSTGQLVDPVPAGEDTARMYVCGITPYDATHMGHAATYVTFDLLHRIWRDSGLAVHYVQNVTDVDDPLLERAERDKIPWTDLAAREIALFFDDMTSLQVIPPREYVGVVQSIPGIAAAVERLLADGRAYRVGGGEDAVAEGSDDVYLDLSQEPRFGTVSGWTRDQMSAVFAERGGDPDRSGKRDPLDPLLWRMERPGEPAWESGALGRGRPGWHIECTCISLSNLGMSFAVQGGGTDLVFPHHEMSAVQAAALTGEWPFARAFVHQAMVGLDGEKMSKSKGNLILVSRLRAAGVDPMAVRLVLLDQHYATPWHWTDELLATAQGRLDRWRAAVSADAGPEAGSLLADVRAALSDDLDAPAALALIDAWVAAQQDSTTTGLDSSAPALVRALVDALLGVRL